VPRAVRLRGGGHPVSRSPGARQAALGGAIWELQAWQEDGTLRSLSGASARDTKEKIRQLLRMDYRTFLASAYLAQGRADEFARAGVSERKKVLADILDLSRYERLEQLAKERRGEADARLLDEERAIALIDREREREDEHREALEQAETRLAELTRAVEGLQATHERLSLEHQRLSEREEQARELEGSHS
jgi:exonuclease SbcC